MKHTTKDGRVLKLSEMGNQHLINTINLIKRKAAKGFTVRYGGGSVPDDFWYDEDHYQGEAAEEYLNLSAYMAELNKRGLSLSNLLK